VWYDAANALNNKAVELNQAGADVFKTAWDLPATNHAGKAVDAFVGAPIGPTGHGCAV
jgi:hypothetical protein